ncbi:hypothetical protein JCM10908_005710 [Rhodotorula pacifica]|uniref:tethering complex subunit PEP5 n=1 Tax=Rhodotorula pacifica TaxID=1495444 RepID=UPI0031777391
MAPRRSQSGTSAAQTSAVAAPAWRQFSFWSCTPASTPSPASDWINQPTLASCIHANPLIGPDGIVLVADLAGGISWVNEQWEIEKSWRCYDGAHARVHAIESREWDPVQGRAIVVTVGEEPSSLFPILKVWLLTLPTPSSTLGQSTRVSTDPPHLTLLRSAPISPTPGRPSPVSSLAVSPTLSHIAVGLADGSVVGWKRVDELIDSSLYDLEEAAARANDPPPGVVVASTSKLRSVVGAGGGARTFQPGGMGKLRVFWEGNKEPVTNLGITVSNAAGIVPTLYILTTSQILALPLASKSKAQPPPSVLDDHGAAVSCAKVMALGGGKGSADGDLAERMVVAREEAIYVYSADGREGCWAYEGPKSSISGLHQLCVSQPTSRSDVAALPTPYLVIVTPPQTSSLASNSATIRNHAARSQGPSPAAGDDQVAKVTLFDPENKFVAFSGTFGGNGGDAGGNLGTEASGIKAVVEAWGAVSVLTETGKLFRLSEQTLKDSFSILFQRNLFTLAIGLAQSRGVGKDEVADIYRRYGDHLYSKSDYEGAMSAYLKTVGSVQASYVIRKFLDAQRLTHLTSYLQELHSSGLANSDITTLLLNCYTKLKDDEAISRFIHSSAPNRGEGDHEDDVPPFDLETAIRVLRQAGYYSHAGWLAERYRAHGEYLRIAIEDTNDFAGALNYVRQLARGEIGGADGRDEAEESMKRWGGVLLAQEPDLTTDVLVEICCGTETSALAKEKDPQQQQQRDRIASGKSEQLPSSARSRTTTSNGAGTAGYDVPDDASTAPPTIVAEPASAFPSPRAFFAHFVDHPRNFIVFLEQVLRRRFGKSIDSLTPPSSLTGTEAPLPAPVNLAEPSSVREDATRDEQVLWNTLLELYISTSNDNSNNSSFEARAVKLLRCREQVPYDETQALLVCTTHGFEDGFVLLYELLGMYEEIVRYWIDASEAEPTQTSLSSRVIRSLRRYGPSCPSLYRVVLSYLTTSSELLSRHQADVVEILDEIDERRIMPAIQVVQILSKNNTASLGLVREYLKRQLLAEKQETESDQALIASYRTETAKKRKEIQELSDPNAPRIFQVTRCSACGGQLDLPAVHFMCRHSYHQRCLGENESQCPNCARSHGVIREIRNNNARLAGQHDAFQQEIAESDDPFATVATAFSRGWMAYDPPEKRTAT